MLEVTLFGIPIIVVIAIAIIVIAMIVFLFTPFARQRSGYCALRFI